jgi:REP element-mobilizing transposase RayT
MPVKGNYTRHLPHQVPEDSPIFLTWNLKGAIPPAAIENLTRQRRRLEEQTPRAGETIAERRIRESKIIYAAADRFLDQAVDGPMHLNDPRATKSVEDAIIFGAGSRYDLFAWCVMSNHVHVLLTPRCELPDVTKGIKGYTAYQINRLQNARGRVFWQDESYDHWARDETEILRIIHYIEQNPVAAGLCQRPENWPRSSARFRQDWPAGNVFERCTVAGD